MRQRKKDRSLQLLEYSALSLAFIGPHDIAKGQVVYTDVDPDSTFYIDEYELDMDNDGSVDFKLIFNTDIFATFAPPELKLRVNPLGSNSVAFMYQSVPVTYSGMPFSTYIDGATAIFFTDVPLMNDGEWVDNGMNFHMEKAALYERLFFYIYSESNYTAIPGGYWNGTTDHFAAIRLFTDGAYHYGWLRLHVDAASGITLVDYAYELNPETAIQALIRDYKISWISAGDVGITETTADLSFSFNAAPDQADIAAYRIFCVPTADVNDMTAEIAATLSADRYVEIIPDGSATYTANFDGILLDSNGDPIVEGVNYKLMAVNIMANNYLPLLSVPSSKFALVNTVQPPINVTLTDVYDAGDGSDVRVKFDAPDIEQGVSAYRIIIVPRDSADTFTLEDAVALSPDRYTEVAVGEPDYNLMLAAGTLDAFGNPVYLDRYKAFVMSVADGTTVAHDALSDDSGVIVLETTTGVASGITLSDIGETGNGNDLHVSFAHGDIERTITEYRLLFVDFAAAFDFDLDAALTSTHYIPFTPDGIDFSFTGNDTLRDSDGDLITWGVPYYAWVVSVSSDFGVDDTLSLPSNQVIMNFPVDIPLIEAPAVDLTIFDNTISVQADLPLIMLVADAAGKVVLHEELAPGAHQVNTALPAGTYFVHLQGRNVDMVRSFVILGGK